MHAQLQSMTHLIASACILLLLFTGVAHYSRRSRLPAEAWMLMIGLGLGLLSKYTPLKLIPAALFSPGLILVGILPLLIFASGRKIRPAILKKDIPEITYLALPGVLITAALFGLSMSWILGIPLGHGLVLGAAVGATDPAAVTSIFQRFRLPEQLNLIVEGESLFNDGTTVVVFSVITGMVLEGAGLDLYRTLGAFVWAVLGALPAGLLLGWLGAWLLRVWHEHQVLFTTSMSLILAYGSFVLAEEFLGVSGVICVLLAALTFARSWQKETVDEAIRDKVLIMGAFWDYISRTLTGFLFVLLGAAVGRHDFVVGIWAMAAAVVLLFLSRVIVVYAGFLLLGLFKSRLSLAWQNIILLSGLRGPVSAALILTLPESFSYKGEFQCLAFVAIAAGLILQPLLVQGVLDRSDVSPIADAGEPQQGKR